MDSLGEAWGTNYKLRALESWGNPCSGNMPGGVGVSDPFRPFQGVPGPSREAAEVLCEVKKLISPPCVKP